MSRTIGAQITSHKIDTGHSGLAGQLTINHTRLWRVLDFHECLCALLLQADGENELFNNLDGPASCPCK